LPLLSTEKNITVVIPFFFFVLSSSPYVAACQLLEKYVFNDVANVAAEFRSKPNLFYY
jgi:hypothetical protein